MAKLETVIASQSQSPTKFLVILTGDCNDGDMVTNTVEVTNFKELEKLKRIWEVVKSCEESHNWPTSHYEDTEPEELYKNLLSPKDIDWFSYYVPYGEHGIHTLESVTVYNYVNKEDL